MKEFKTWSWGFIPALAALGLIWFEFWQSSRAHRDPLTTPPVVAPDDGTGPAADATSPAVQPENLSPGVTTAAPTVAAVVPAHQAPAATADGFDTRLLTEPPPISLRVNDANLNDVAQALSAALGAPSAVLAATPGNARYSLDIKEKPFWDVFQALQDQTPFNAVEGTAGLRLTPADSSQGGIRHFQRHGPAILFARSISFARSSSGPGTMSLVMGAVIDPRLKVTRHGPIVILDAQDETGRVQSVPELPVGDNMQVRAGNFWTQGVSWPANGTAAKNITLHCEVRFGVEASSTAPTTTVEDAQSKTGEIIPVGDQQVRIVRFTNDGSRIFVQVEPAQGGNASVSFMVYDAAGKSYGNSTTIATNASFAAPGAQGPFRLVLRAVSGETRTLSYQFDLPEIPVP